MIFPMIGWSLSIGLFGLQYAFIRKLPMEFDYLYISTYFFGGGMIFYMAIYAIGTDVTRPEERAQR